LTIATVSFTASTKPCLPLPVGLRTCVLLGEHLAAQSSICGFAGLPTNLLNPVKNVSPAMKSCYVLGLALQGILPEGSDIFLTFR
jgi:hypothetical protein